MGTKMKTCNTHCKNIRWTSGRKPSCKKCQDIAWFYNCPFDCPYFDPKHRKIKSNLHGKPSIDRKLITEAMKNLSVQNK